MKKKDYQSPKIKFLRIDTSPLVSSLDGTITDDPAIEPAYSPQPDDVVIENKRDMYNVWDM